MKRFLLATPRLLFALCLSGCASVNLIQLDNEWARTYQARMQAAAPGSDYLATAANYEAQFADLSDRAEAAAKKSQDDISTQVSFYRIAALAAWQSGARREDRIPLLTDAGAKACDALPNKDASQPRDCALFKFICPFALQGKQATRYQQLVAQSAQSKLNDQQLEQARALFGDVRSNFSAIQMARSATLTLPVAPNFPGYINENWIRVFCTAEGILGLSEKLRDLTSATASMEKSIQQDTGAAGPVNCRDHGSQD